MSHTSHSSTSFRRLTLALHALLLGVLVVFVSFAITNSRDAGAASSTPGIGVLRYGDSYDQASGYDRYSYVLVGLRDGAAAGTLPTTSLQYMSGAAIQTGWLTGVSYQDALANGWLLKNASGAYLRTPYSAYVGDIGDARYRQRWLENVIPILERQGNEGIFIDDVNSTNTWGASTKYPTDQAWEEVMVSFIAAVGPELKRRGFYVVANAASIIPNDGRSATGEHMARFNERLAPHVSALMTEYWEQTPHGSSEPVKLRSSGTSSWTQHWDTWLDIQRRTQAAGADFFTVMYGSSGDVNVMRYGRASFLLEWDGSGGAFMYEASGDPWHVEWTMDVGQPSAPRYRVGVGWRREYSGGTVLVNPDPSASQTFALGATYTRGDGTSVSTVTLGPTSGLVLKRGASSSSAPAPTAPPPPPPTPSAAKPSIPTGLSAVSAADGTRVNLAWNANPSGESVDRYQVYEADANLDLNVPANSFAVTKDSKGVPLVPGQTYAFRVSAHNAQGYGNWSGTVSVTLQGSAPAPPPPTPSAAKPSIPTGLSAVSAADGTRVNLAWNANPSGESVDRYQVYEADANLDLNVPANSFAVTKDSKGVPLVPGQTYAFRVSAHNAQGYGNWSETVSVTLQGSAPAPPPPTPSAAKPSIPTGLSAVSAADGTRVNLAWNANPSGESVDRYQVYEADANLDLNVPANSFAVTKDSKGVPLVPGQTYAFRVSAHNAQGYGNWSGTVSVTLQGSAPAPPPPTPSAAKPSIPTGLSAVSAADGTRVNLAWDANPSGESVDRYQVYEADANLDLNVPANSFAVTKDSKGVPLVPGQTYAFRVSAHNAQGYGNWSGTVSVTLLGASRPNAPVNVDMPAITGVAQEATTLSASAGTWSGSPTQYAYAWKRCDATGSACVSTSAGNVTRYTLGAVDVGNTIRVSVTATNASGSTVATSAATSLVAPPPERLLPPTIRIRPVVEGIATEGVVLTTSAGTWSNSPSGYGYQWKRCSAAGQQCTSIDDATEPRYQLTANDVAHTLRVFVTATNEAGVGGASSDPTTVVSPKPLPPPPPSVVINPSISGTARVGGTVILSKGTWTGDPERWTYQWRRCTKDGAACSDISGANAATYAVEESDLQHCLQGLVRAWNAGGSGAAYTSHKAALCARRGVVRAAE